MTFLLKFRFYLRTCEQFCTALNDPGPGIPTSDKSKKRISAKTYSLLDLLLATAFISLMAINSLKGEVKWVFDILIIYWNVKIFSVLIFTSFYGLGISTVSALSVSFAAKRMNVAGYYTWVFFFAKECFLSEKSRSWNLIRHNFYRMIHTIWSICYTAHDMHILRYM